MNNNEIIKNILIKELSKCNKFIYDIQINNLILKINTKKSYPSLIDYSIRINVYTDSEWIFSFNKKNNVLLPFNHNIFSKIEKRVMKIQYNVIKEILENIIKEYFNLY